MIDVVVGIAVAVCSAELLLVLLSQALRDCIVGDTEDIVHQLQVRLGLVLHDGITQRNELYLLQTFVLLVVSVIAFRPIAELGRNGMFIAYLLDNSPFFYPNLLLMRQSFLLS